MYLLDSRFNPLTEHVSKRVSQVCLTVAALLLIVIVGIAVWPQKKLSMHDITVNLYYTDSTMQTRHFEKLHEEFPRIESCHGMSCFYTGRESIEDVERYEVVNDFHYKISVKELREFILENSRRPVSSYNMIRNAHKYTRRADGAMVHERDRCDVCLRISDKVNN